MNTKTQQNTNTFSLDTAADTLNAIYYASQDANHSFWEGIIGGATAARLAAMAKLYSEIPVDIYNAIHHEDLNNKKNTYLVIGPSFVGPANRKMDLRIVDPSVDQEGTVTFRLNPFAPLELINSQYHLSKIGGNGERSNEYLNFSEIKQFYIGISRADVEAGAVTESVYKAIVDYANRWQTEVVKFNELKAANPNIKATEFIYLKAASPEDKWKYLSVIPENDMFEFVVEPCLGVYNPDANTFSVALRFKPIDLHNFQVLGTGYRNIVTINVANGTKKPSVSVVSGPAPVVDTSLPAVPSVPALPVSAATPTPSNEDQEIAAMKAEIARLKAAQLV